MATDKGVDLEFWRQLLEQVEGEGADRGALGYDYGSDVMQRLAAYCRKQMAYHVADKLKGQQDEIIYTEVSGTYTISDGTITRGGK